MATAHCRCVNGHDFKAKCIEEPDENATIVEENCTECDSDEFEILDVSYPEYLEDDEDRFLRKILPGD